MEKVIRDLSQEILDRGPISEKFYERYDVKRGLRNQDGSGVLVGLTEVGNVHGFVVVEKDVTPADGQLSYRGYDIKELVNGFQSEKRFGFEEVIYLLLFGKLPTAERLTQFCDLIKNSMDLPHRFNEDMIMSAPSNNIMNKLARSVLALYSYDPNPDDLSIENVLDTKGFAQIRPGMTEDQVLKILGPSYPAWTSYFSARDERVWQWRYCDDRNIAGHFSVLFNDSARRVRTTMSVPESCGLAYCSCSK